ncbi:hypothetical protein BD410DRAFT_150601 [Rickenella mellea]|uniref:C2H2-type domain-containing protein n=1 Tax=Rickenella mellea TaxID=50990 RepID=A0A4Y7QA95_9AGAM|nr:hypothetical protein BD410DRAFT_150601 [Rickenella mellea]
MGWMDAIMTTAMALWPWSGGYHRERRLTKQLNRQWMLRISQAEKIRPCVLLQSSTLVNVIERFTDAQSVVTLTVWRSIRPTVLREVAQYRAGMRALPLHKNCTDTVQCPFCPRSTCPRMFKGGVALETHVRQKHPDRNHLEIVKKSRSR